MSEVNLVLGVVAAPAPTDATFACTPDNRLGPNLTVTP